MLKLKDITDSLDVELQTEKIQDYSLNGLQVEGKEKISKISFAVDLSLKTIEKCIKNKSDMIIVHHGIFWKNSPIAVTGMHKTRIKYLLDNGISVYASHLPLDLHPVYGNNVSICRLLKLTRIEKFGNYNGVTIGFCGYLRSKMKFEKFVGMVKRNVCQPNHIIQSCESAYKIGVVSGGGSGLFGECKKIGIDTFITGEQNYTVQNFAVEEKINIIFGGHYNTEIFGVKSIMNFIKKKFPAISLEFIDIPSVL
ncbi:MAG TPA: Nif3-like dinuclear metal center hexameric protein [bacterium]|nr:Nif3-like dinuclear metal center hexameric protein [bacterium]